MPEERSYRTPGRRQENKPEKRSKKPALAGMQVVAVQSISCVVVLLLVLAFKLVGGEAFAQLRGQFNDAIMSNSILAALAAVLESPDEEPGASSEPPVSSPSSSTEDASSGLPNSTASPSGPSVSSGETTAEASTGKTVPNAQGVRLAPEGAAFVPVHSNRAGTAPLESGRLTSGYGYRENPTKEGVGFHRGLDIGASEGTPIRAMYFGVVAQTGTSSTYGKFIKLFHGNGLEVLYAHCSEILAEEGAMIREGEVVAKVGATGDVTGSHLHVETKVDGVVYDPAGIVPVARYV